MITTEELAKAGYGKYNKPGSKPYAEALYQKAIWVDEVGCFVEKTDPKRFKKAFYINIWHYAPAPELGLPKESFSTEVRLYAPDGLSWDVELFSDRSHTVEFVEAFYKRQYDANGCIPDVDNND